MDPRTVCVVIPVLNEAEVIEQVLENVLADFPDVVCVEDGSSDGSAEAIPRTGAALVRHPINIGQTPALQMGSRSASSPRPCAPSSAS